MMANGFTLKNLTQEIKTPEHCIPITISYFKILIQWIPFEVNTFELNPFSHIKRLVL
jgi:hypothetical protein